MIIETKRLILRPFEESDYDDLFESLSQLKNDEFEATPELLMKTENRYGETPMCMRW